MSVAERWATVRASIPAHVQIIAVSKLHPASVVREAAAAGVTDVGENYAQEMTAKQDEVADPALRWHFIGRLQRNKVKMLAGRAALIHAVDSLELAQEIAKRAPRPQDILVAVNTGGEAQKTGLSPDDAPAIIEAIAALPNLIVRGLMTMPPLADDPETTRPHFRALRALRDRLGLEHLSMGTTSDFRIAIEEGATMVRIGTAIFGERP